MYGVAHLRAEYPNLDRIRVGTLEPDTQGLALERLLEMDANASWAKEALWSNGTLVEFGLFTLGDGHALMRVNAEVSGRIWPGRY